MTEGLTVTIDDLTLAEMTEKEMKLLVESFAKILSTGASARMRRRDRLEKIKLEKLSG